MALTLCFVHAVFQQDELIALDHVDHLQYCCLGIAGVINGVVGKHKVKSV